MVAAYNEAEVEQHKSSRMSEFLDEVVPLKGATHAEVVGYKVEIPMRYAECFADLRDGRRVPLKNRRQLVGWTGHRRCRSLLFRSDGLRVVIDIDANGASGPVRELYVQTKPSPIAAVPARANERIRKFIGIDGSQVMLSIT